MAIFPTFHPQFVNLVTVTSQCVNSDRITHVFFNHSDNYTGILQLSNNCNFPQLVNRDRVTTPSICQRCHPACVTTPSATLLTPLTITSTLAQFDDKTALLKPSIWPRDSLNSRADGTHNSLTDVTAGRSNGALYHPMRNTHRNSIESHIKSMPVSVNLRGEDATTRRDYGRLQRPS